MIFAYTDGACLRNPGKGGIGYLMYDLKTGEKREFSLGFKLSTNNRMELLAVIYLLTYLTNTEDEINVFTDSEYVKKGCSEWLKFWKFRNWKTKDGNPVQNKDLWLELEKLMNGKSIHFFWIKGHDGIEGNEIANGLAYEACNDKDLLIDSGYERNK